MPSFEIPVDIFTHLAVFDPPEGSSNTFNTRNYRMAKIYCHNIQCDVSVQYFAILHADKYCTLSGKPMKLKIRSFLSFFILLLRQFRKIMALCNGKGELANSFSLKIARSQYFVVLKQ